MLIPEKDIHKGHRARMKAKLYRHGSDIFDTYELLEMLLYYSIPYKDTNPIAKQLLARFGSLGAVLNAPKEELIKISGVGERCAEFLGAVSRMMVCDDIAGEYVPEVFDDYAKAGSYLVDHFSSCDDKICVMLLDNSMRLIKTKTIPGTNFGSASVRPKYFIDAALEYGASVAIIANVHEFGALYPTESDMATSKLVRTELSNVGVIVAEHYVVSGKSYMGIRRRLAHGVSSMPSLDKFMDSIPSIEEVRDSECR